jgi:BCD family chlorophyll transporter-like MFS transporter
LATRLGKPTAAVIGGVLAGAGLLLIAFSGLLRLKALFIPGLVVFGFGSGISTAANLALMLDMTLAGQVGLFLGAWGMADALARLFGTLLSGIVRDSVNALTHDVASGYVTVFLIEALMLAISLLLLRRISVARFREDAHTTLADLAALVGDAQGG